jgi:pyrroline-5-carboxylate reductase
MQITEKNILFIGGGTMAEALIKGLLTSHITSPEKITVSDVNESRLSWLHEEYRINTTVPEKLDVTRARIIILSVKPEVLPAVVDGISADITPGQIVISIAIGVSTSEIEKKLKDTVAVVRVMPNIPAVVQRGMIAIARGSFATEADTLYVRVLFSTVGMVMDIDETLMDTFTVVSGSGPAYVFYLMEGMITAAEKHGMSKTQALSVVAEVIRGAGEMIVRTHQQPAQLRVQSTMPGGPTDEAIRIFKEHDLNAVVIHAVDAAIKRCRELT